MIKSAPNYMKNLHVALPDEKAPAVLALAALRLWPMQPKLPAHRSTSLSTWRTPASST
jgi:hypothetical protein